MGLTLIEYFHGKMQSLIAKIKENPEDLDFHIKFKKQYYRFYNRCSIPTKELHKYRKQVEEISEFGEETLSKIMGGEYD